MKTRQMRKTAVIVMLIAGLLLSSRIPGLFAPYPVQAASGDYVVTGTTNYLALRSSPGYDAWNEIGRLYNGATVRFENVGNGTYWYVYSYSLNKYGYVNYKYLKAAGNSGSQQQSDSGSMYTVSGTKYYLALRSSPGYLENEIGKLYNGENVQKINSGDGNYWYVYAPKLDKYGYVNADYVVNSGNTPSSYGMYRVAGVKNYLALRSAPEYNAWNEIGKMYNGEEVEVLNKGTGSYWYVYSGKLGKNGYVNSTYLLPY